MLVIKRNGQEVQFDKDKIINAITKAFDETEKANGVSYSNCRQETIDKIANKLCQRYSKRNRAIEVEEIQDDVENELMKSGFHDVARAYIKYRYLHDLSRNQYNELMKAVAEKLKASNVENQNANVDEHSFGGRAGEASRVVTKQYALDYCMSEMAKNNHLNNEIYIHN